MDDVAHRDRLDRPVGMLHEQAAGVVDAARDPHELTLRVLDADPSSER